MPGGKRLYVAPAFQFVPKAVFTVRGVVGTNEGGEMALVLGMETGVARTVLERRVEVVVKLMEVGK